MNIDGCKEGFFTDLVLNNRSFACDYQTAAWNASVVVLLLTYIIATLFTFGKWCRRERRRRQRMNTTRYRRDNAKYLCHRRLPVLPMLILGISATSVAFWTLTSSNAINVRNGWSVVLFTLHILMAFILLHFYLLRFVRIGLRITPLSRQIRLVSAFQQMGSSGEFNVPPSHLVIPDNTTGLDLPLKVGFGISTAISIGASIVGMLGGAITAKNGGIYSIITACAILFGVNGMLLLILFNWQLHRNIVAIETFKRLDVSVAVVDQSLKMLKQQRFVSFLIMAVMTSLSFVLAFNQDRPFWLILAMDYLIVAYTILLWIADILTFVQSRRTLVPSNERETPRGQQQTPPNVNAAEPGQAVLAAAAVGAEREVTPKSSRSKVQPFGVADQMRNSSSPKSKGGDIPPYMALESVPRTGSSTGSALRAQLPERTITPESLPRVEVDIEQGGAGN